MKTEFEIAFSLINREQLQNTIKSLGGICSKENTLMKRVVFDNPTKKNSYVRVRDEGDKITCTYKEISDGELDIHSVKELETELKDFEQMVQIFTNLGLRKKAEQESYREVWEIAGEVEIMIDFWPGLEPFVEIEGASEQVVQNYVEKLGFSWNDGIFGAVDQIYKKELGIPEEFINNLEEITFSNPPKNYGAI